MIKLCRYRWELKIFRKLGRMRWRRLMIKFIKRQKMQVSWGKFILLIGCMRIISDVKLLYIRAVNYAKMASNVMNTSLQDKINFRPKISKMAKLDWFLEEVKETINSCKFLKVQKTNGFEYLISISFIYGIVIITI